MSNSPEDFLPITEEQFEIVQDNMARFRGMSEKYTNDLGNFAVMIARLGQAEQHVWATEVPDDYIWYTNSTNVVLDWTYVSERVLQNLGAPIVTVAAEGDRDDRIYDKQTQVAHYALHSSPSINTIDFMISDGKYTGFELLNIYHSDLLPSGHIFSPDSFVGYRSIEGVETLESEGLLERHFLFSALLSGVTQLTEPRDSFSNLLDEDDRQSLALYEKLREQGHQPLGPEEVYGIMTAAILSFFEQHPEHDFRNTDNN